jgi:hypothetical protein
MDALSLVHKITPKNRVAYPFGQKSAFLFSCLQSQYGFGEVFGVANKKESPGAAAEIYCFILWEIERCG